MGQGTFLLTYSGDGFAYALYSLEDYYVETIISNMIVCIVDIVPFRTGWRLEKYLAELQLPHEINGNISRQ